MRKVTHGLIAIGMAICSLIGLSGPAHADGWYLHASYGGTAAGFKACNDGGRFMMWTHSRHIKAYNCDYQLSGEGHYVWNLYLYMVA